MGQFLAVFTAITQIQCVDNVSSMYEAMLGWFVWSTTGETVWMCLGWTDDLRGIRRGMRKPQDLRYKLFEEEAHE
jgi:hypothetical protein